MSKTTAVNWFNRFQSGDTSLQDKHRSGPTSTVDDEALHKVVEQQQPTSSSRGLSAQLGPHFSTIDHHLHQLGFSNRHPRVIPHELSPEQCQCRLDICRKFIAGPKDDRLWKGIVTGDEKWPGLF